jgi:hypothetical protein
MAAKTKNNGMKLCFVVLMCLDTVANSEPCECMYDGQTLPEETWAQVKNPLFGTYCNNWNNMPEALDHLEEDVCPPSKKCHKDCDWMLLPWCYVKEGCTGAEYGDTAVTGLGDAKYSYEVCGAPKGGCYADKWDDAECPAGHGCKHDHHCHCLFEDKVLPLAAAEKAGNPYYGTNCDMEWDSMPGTKFYADAPTGDKTCFGEHGDHCSKECNWRHAHFCYVEMGCEGLPAEDVVLSEWSEELAAGAEEDVKEVGYSYAMCQYANCYGDHYDTSPECPFGEACLTCEMVKKDYKEEHCCGNPEQHIIIHHMYHKMGEFH